MGEIQLINLNTTDPTVTSWLYDFMHRNTIEDDTIILPMSPEDIHTPNLTWYEARGHTGAQRVGIVSFKVVTPHLVDLQRTMVDVKYRRMGYGRDIGTAIEKEIRELGYGKIMMSCYSTNTAIINLKLSEGYVIEGLLRNHYDVGKHDYIFGKELT